LCKEKDKVFHLNKCETNFDAKKWLLLDNNEKQKTFTTEKALIGLHNLGNSCYMNCTLQCLLHIPALNKFFLEGMFLKELNTSNKLGCQG